MDRDIANFTVATVTGVWSWVTAENLAIIVPCLWAFYVLMLIAKTLPDVIEKHAWVGRMLSCVAGRFVRAFQWGRRIVRGEEK